MLKYRKNLVLIIIGLISVLKLCYAHLGKKSKRINTQVIRSYLCPNLCVGSFLSKKASSGIAYIIFL